MTKLLLALATAAALLTPSLAQADPVVLHHPTHALHKHVVPHVKAQSHARALPHGKNLPHRLPRRPKHRRHLTLRH